MFPNRWLDPRDDRRFDGLLEIANGIHDCFDAEAGEVDKIVAAALDPEAYSFPLPLQLAEMMEKAASNIRKATLAE